MQTFTAGLFDRLDDDSAAPQRTRDQARAHSLNQAMRSVTRDLQALLNTRSAVSPAALAPYPALSSSTINYGLTDFAGMCMNSDTDRSEICKSVRLAIERHEPRLQQVTVILQAGQGAINRVDFVITARLKHAPRSGPLSFNAVFCPSLPQYSIAAITH